MYFFLKLQMFSYLTKESFLDLSFVSSMEANDVVWGLGIMKLGMVVSKK